MNTALSQYIGQSQMTEDIITQNAVERFCAIIGNEYETDVAPLGFHWCLCLPNESMEQLGVDGHPKVGDFLPSVDLPRRMWAASNVEFLGTLPIGEKVTRQSTVVSIREKSGKTGRLIFVGLEHESKVQKNTVVRERQTIVYRKATDTVMPLPADNAAPPPDWHIIEKIAPTPQLLFRYSALTFNSHRIHYDLPYTRTQEMYPDLVVQAPLTATLLLQLAARQGEVRHYSFRAVAAAFCNQTLFLTANFNQKQGELSAIGGDGRCCLSANVQLNGDPD